jgi:hypothetical protein
MVDEAPRVVFCAVPRHFRSQSVCGSPRSVLEKNTNRYGEGREGK